MNRLRARLARDESGMTLVELIVAVSIFAVFMSMLVATVIAFNRGATRIQLTTQSTSGALAVFETFDRQVRYANAINFPGTGSGSSGAVYVEWRTPAGSASDGVVTCTQWRYLPTERRLETREWKDVAGATLSQWTTKLSNVNPGGTGYPFELIAASATGSSSQRLTLTLDVGSEQLAAGGAITSTYVAGNSSLQSPSNADADGDGNSDSPVCLATGSRP